VADPRPCWPVLLCDIGNTHCDWALAGQAGWIARGRAPSERIVELFAQDWRRFDAPCRILAANVAGSEAAQALAQGCRALWGRAPEFLRAPARGLGVVNGYRQPGQLGIDRWLALVAAAGLGSEPACVVDCGSAITIDLLATEGRHLGGVILPGLAMMERALRAGTRIPPYTHRGASDLAAKDTGAAIHAGALLAAAAAVERATGELRLRVGARVRLMLTGGAAPQLFGSLREPFQYQPDLVLQGMLLYASQAKPVEADS